jgi:hypothetical protein
MEGGREGVREGETVGVIVYRVCLYACMLVCVGGGLGARARVGQHAYLYACVLYV